MEEIIFKNLNLNLNNVIIKKREIIINKFIEKFPKAKLCNIIEINKHITSFYKKIENF